MYADTAHVSSSRIIKCLMYPYVFGWKLHQTLLISSALFTLSREQPQHRTDVPIYYLPSVSFTRFLVISHMVMSIHLTTSGSTAKSQMDQKKNAPDAPMSFENEVTIAWIICISCDKERCARRGQGYATLVRRARWDLLQFATSILFHEMGERRYTHKDLANV